jgi:hypothetical protein
VAGHPLQRRFFTTVHYRLRPSARAVTVASAWSCRIWGHTLCSTDSAAAFTCATGAVECSGRGAAPLATLVEFTLAGGAGGDDFYDVSLVDGFNVPMLVTPAADGRCQATGCAADLSVATASSGEAEAAVACRSACEAFGAAQYCCSGDYGSPATCPPTSYSRFFKDACPRAYSYAYDDATSTFTCAAPGAGYGVVFCPSSTSRYIRTRDFILFFTSLFR